jgi:hypothetical protein
MGFSQTARFNLWKIDTGTVDQTTGDKVKENTDKIDANLGKLMADSGDTVADFLAQKLDQTSLEVDPATHKAYAKQARLVLNAASDADFTLTPGQQRHAQIAVTDTAGLLTAARNLIVPTENRIWWFENLTTRQITVKPATGSGVAVVAGNRALVACNGVNVVALSSSGGGGGTGDMSKSTYDPATIAEQMVGVSAAQSLTNKRIRYAHLLIAASTTIQASHESLYLYGTNAAAILLTLPTHASAALPVGFECWVVTTGAGSITISPDSGVTLNGAASAKNIATGFKAAHLRKMDTNAWMMVGG